MIDQVSVLILGCCMSRDFLEFQNQSAIQINKFVSQNSFHLLFQEPLPEDITKLKDYIPWKTKWNSSCFELECTTNLDYLLRNYKSDFLIFDTYNMAFDILEIVKNSLKFYLTMSIDLCENKTALIDFFSSQGFYTRIIYSEEISDYMLEKSIKNISSLIKQYYKPHQIILNTFEMAKLYTCNDKLLNFKNDFNIKKINKIMKKSNNLFVKYLGDEIHLIKSPANCIANSNHKWGLYNLHMIDEYYLYLLECFNNIVNSPKKDLRRIKIRFENIIQKKYYRLSYQMGEQDYEY